MYFRCLNVVPIFNYLTTYLTIEEISCINTGITAWKNKYTHETRYEMIYSRM